MKTLATPVIGGKWFARIIHGEWLVALCCPLCTDTFERNPRPYIRRIEMLAQTRSGEDSAGLAV